MTKSHLPLRPLTLGTAAYENVCKSKGVSHKTKTAYLLALAACKKSSRCAKRVHQQQCAGNSRTGPKPKDLDPYEGLGVLVPENKFIEHTAAAFGRFIKDFAKDVDNWVRFHEKRALGVQATETERLATFKFMRAKVPARSFGSIWLFRNPSRTRDAFAGLADPWLGHRLGLNLAPTPEVRLTFGFRAGHVVDPRRPTFRDVAWVHRSLWHWSGITQPLPKTPAGMTGLEEVVAISPELSQLDRDVTRITVQRV
jgi:hypothetical protein